MIELPLLDITATRRSERPIPPFDPTARRSTGSQDWTYEQCVKSGMAMEPDPFNVLVLNYTMKCPLACDFCCYACNPGRKETMSLDLALDLVDQAAALGVFGQGGFTGGEPLLFADEILQIARRMHEYSLPYSIISSCHWATDEHRVDRLLDDLVETGLAVFSISFDPSHGKWVDPSNVRRVVDRLIHLSVPAVICGSFYDAAAHVRDEFPEYDELPGVELSDRVVLPVGVSGRMPLTPKSYGLQIDPSSLRCYKHAYHDLTVFWDGEAYPCCSVYNRSTKGISLGNVYDTPLAEIWDAVQGSLLYRIMKSRGFAEIYRLIAEHDPDLLADLPPLTEALGPCQLCHQIFSDKALSPRVKAVFTDIEITNMSHILDVISR